MARVPLTRNSTGNFAKIAQIAAGTNVTISEALVGEVLTVTVNASAGGAFSLRGRFVATAGQTFFPVSGLSTDPSRSMVTRNGIIMSEGSDNDYLLSSTGVTFVYGLDLDTVVQVFS